MKLTIAIIISFFCMHIIAQDSLYLPSSKGELIHHTYYDLDYSELHEQAFWVAYTLRKEDVFIKRERTDDFRQDTFVSTGSAELEDYKGSGYDRGHLAPAADMKHDSISMSESFYMSNMSPQLPAFNRYIWKYLEDTVRTWAIDNHSIFVVTGPVLSDSLGTIGPNRVTIPSFYYKVIYDYVEPEIKAIGLVLPNCKGEGPFSKYAVSIDSIEILTGIDFFPNLCDSLENLIESKFEIDKWFK